mgnify:CR=1 FL=1
MFRIGNAAMTLEWTDVDLPGVTPSRQKRSRATTTALLKAGAGMLRTRSLDDLSIELDGKVKIVKLDVESNPSTVTTYNVRAMPTLMVFKDGEPIDVKIGYGPSRAQLTKWLESFA